MADKLHVREAFLQRVGELEDTDPESCVRAFYLCRHLIQLKKILRQAEQEWMEEFLGRGGLVAIFDALSALGRKEVTTIADVIPQLECVECLKAVMSTYYGLEHMIRNCNEKYVNKLVLELETDNILVKLHLFLLLSALCKHSHEGYEATISALDHFKRVNSRRHRYSVVVQELEDTEEFPQYQAAILAFVNYLVSACKDLDARVKLRTELSALKLPDILAIIRYTDSECLSEQVRIYESRQIEDQHKMDMPGGVDVTNHEHLFRAVLEKVFDTPQSSSFLHIMQNLLLIERDTAKGDAIWGTLERIVDSTLTMSGHQQAERLYTTGVQRMRRALEEEEQRKENTAAEESSAVPPQEATSSGESTQTHEQSETESQQAPPPPPPPGPGFGWVVSAVNKVLSVFDKARQYKPKKRMKKVNWEKVSKGDAEASMLWCNASDPAASLRVMISEEALEILFSLRDQAKEAAKEKETKPFLPNQKKALNVNIILESLKRSNSEVVEAVHNGDISVFSLNQASVLCDQMPGSEDISFLSQFEEDPSPLGTPEDFLLRLAHLEGYPLRLQLLKTRIAFEEILNEYLPSFRILEVALDELMECTALQELFYIILLIGNIINGGTQQGGAYGFKVSSLQKLSDTLANANVSKPNVNLLHYLVTVCEEDCPSLLQLPSQLKHTDEASRIALDGKESISEEVEERKKEIEEMEEQLKSLENPPADLREQFQAFLPVAHEKFHILDSRMAEVRTKGQVAARYFSDSRDDFLEKVFLEIKTFKDEFKKTVKETLKEKPIQLVLPTTPVSPQTKEKPPVHKVELKTRDKGIVRAVSIITEPEFDYTALAQVSTTEYESSEQAIVRAADVLESAPSPQPQIAITDLEDQEELKLESQPAAIEQESRKASWPVYRRIQSMNITSSFKRCPRVQRLPSVDPRAMFGSSLDDVARILGKMALAIQADLEEDTH